MRNNTHQKGKRGTRNFTPCPRFATQRLQKVGTRMWFLVPFGMWLDVLFIPLVLSFFFCTMPFLSRLYSLSTYAFQLDGTILWHMRMAGLQECLMFLMSLYIIMTSIIYIVGSHSRWCNNEVSDDKRGLTWQNIKKKCASWHQTASLFHMVAGASSFFISYKNVQGPLCSQNDILYE